MGTADIALEVGRAIFSHNMVIVEDGDLRFPENTDLILGADMLIGKQVDISTSRWGLVHEEEVLEYFEPTLVNGSLFSHAEADYIQNCNNPETELESEDLAGAISQDSLSCSSSRGKKPGVRIPNPGGK